jgi:hypothetical protein
MYITITNNLSLPCLDFLNDLTILPSASISVGDLIIFLSSPSTVQNFVCEIFINLYLYQLVITPPIPNAKFSGEILSNNS